MLKALSLPQSRLIPPAWVDELLHKYPGQFSVHNSAVVGAETLSDAELSAQVCRAYEKNLAGVSACGQHPIRFWNNVPGLTAPASEHRNRYMVFNAGRYEALRTFYGDVSQFDARMPAATAISAGGNDLEIYCLAADVAPESLNNPRQVAPYHYSRRFGPMPPCFARAVKLVRPANWLVVGGTAAIRGEDSVYREDLTRQINETLANLAALVGAAKGNKSSADKQLAENLTAYRELRVYFPNPEHEGLILPIIQAAFPNVRHIEMLIADLCRPELLVEIEGVAELPT